MIVKVTLFITGAIAAFYYFFKRDSEYCPTPIKDPFLLFISAAASYFLGLQYIEAAGGALLAFKQKRIITTILLMVVMYDTLAKPWYYGFLLSFIVIRWECTLAPKYEKTLSIIILTILSPISLALYPTSYALSKKFKPTPEVFALAMIISLIILYRYGYTQISPITALALGSMYGVKKRKKSTPQCTRYIYA